MEEGVECECESVMWMWVLWRMDCRRYASYWIGAISTLVFKIVANFVAMSPNTFSSNILSLKDPKLPKLWLELSLFVEALAPTLQLLVLPVLPLATHVNLAFNNICLLGSRPSLASRMAVCDSAGTWPAAEPVVRDKESWDQDDCPSKLPLLLDTHQATFWEPD